MINYTTDCYEVKREILNFSGKMSKGLSKPKIKFVDDMQYGISKNQSCLISEISRSLNEDTKLKNTIERLCDNLVKMTKEDCNTIYNNYINEIEKYFPEEEPTALFDDSDIAKPHGRKFEDIDKVVDASDPNKKVLNGYHVCEAVILGKNEKQPFSVYSKIYSTTSKGFLSTKNYTKESIDKVSEILGRKSNMVFDRGYDDNKIIDYITKLKNKDNSTNNFVIRMKNNRNFYFKGKKKNCHFMAIRRKGKVKMKLLFDDDEIEVSVSHTKVVLPYNKEEYELVFVYGLDKEEPMILLTNRDIHNKKDLIKVVRLYFYRWRIEVYFRSKKQEYDFENMRVRTLKAMNNLNLMLLIHMGHLACLIEDMDKKLLSIKIQLRNNALKEKVVIWFGQFAKGISNILSYAHEGIRRWQNIEERSKFRQLQLKL